MDVQIYIKQIVELAGEYCPADGEVGICEHTDDILPGDIYIARGRGKDFIKIALQRGAAIVLTEDAVYADKQVYVVDSLDEVVTDLLQHIYARAILQVSLIGITGTNGKTSTASFVCELLNLQGKKAGYIGTLGYGVIGEGLVRGRNTTPDMVTLYRYIAQLAVQGCQYIVMEVSSHGIALGRIAGLQFELAAFTNLSRDHLDFHGSMQEYEAAKQSLFFEYDIKHLVLNLDDEAGRNILSRWQDEKPANTVHGYAAHDVVDSGLSLLRYAYKGRGVDGANQILIQYLNEEKELSVFLYGAFNIENLAAAVTICMALGFPLDEIAKLATQVSPVPGRMEYLRSKNSVNVFIDYAHTPAGVSHVLSDATFQSDTNWCVLGCGGDRDAGKRAAMAGAAVQYASHVVLCDDNVRNDSATQIISDMLKGVKDKSGITVCRDRRQAIHYALSNAQAEDNVFILGKGDEIKIDYGKYFLEQRDRSVVQQYVRQQ